MISGVCRSEEKWVYPVAEKGDAADVYFGTEVSDPYRWLEDDNGSATARWVEQENRVTGEYLRKIPFRDRLAARMTELMDYERCGLPVKKRGKYYFFKNGGLQNQSVLHVKDSLNGRERVLLDPNRFSDDGTVALDGVSFSNNGKYMAFTSSRSGSDWREIRVLDLGSGKILDDRISWVKFSGASWQGDGFYYSAYNSPEAGKEFSGVNENLTVYYHRLGDPQAQDEPVFRNPKEPRRFYKGNVSRDEQLLYITESGAGSGNNLFIKDLRRADAPVVVLTDNMEYTYHPFEKIGNTIYIYTNYGAAKYRVMTADVGSPKPADWKELVPESEAVLSDAGIIGGRLILTYEKNAAHRVYVYGLDGKPLHEISLPGIGTVGFSGDKDDREMFFSFTSFTYPATVFRYDLEANVSERYLSPTVAFTPEDYITEQVFYPSRDGTDIPMFLTYKKGLKRDGNNPVYLYGYGGFNISLNPGFSTSRLTFIENGGIYVQTGLRGGGEYGEEWHQAGTKLNKQNVFDDFIAAAEYLIREGYTGPERLAVVGGSNGGLLVGAVVNQRPELFKVAVPMVGVMDMLRYHIFTIGWNWASDYGTSADSEAMFRYLYAYSPLHNIRNDGTAYPAILVTTADHDDRVVPAHSFKYAATLQASDTGDAPKLIRIDAKAGHGSGKPLAKQIEESADIYAFIMYNLGMTVR